MQRSKPNRCRTPLSNQTKAASQHANPHRAATLSPTPRPYPPMSQGKLLYAQSGGVTAVINATASAVITTARAAVVQA